MNQYAVYALGDPFTGDIRYIGCSIKEMKQTGHSLLNVAKGGPGGTNFRRVIREQQAVEQQEDLKTPSRRKGAAQITKETPPPFADAEVLKTNGR